MTACKPHQTGLGHQDYQADQPSQPSQADQPTLQHFKNYGAAQVYVYSLANTPKDPQHGHHKGLQRGHYKALQQSLLLERLQGYVPTLERLDITYNHWGKPRLKDHDGIHFNLSRSKHMLAIVVSTSHQVGVDIQYMHKHANAASFHACNTQVFTKAELLFLQQSNAPLLSFYALWTRKEAALKALGTGFCIDASTVEVLGDTSTVGTQSVRLHETITTNNCCMTVSILED